VGVAALAIWPSLGFAQEAIDDLRESVDASAADQIVTPAVPPPPPTFDPPEQTRKVNKRRKQTDALGLRVDSLIAYPSLETGLIASSNAAQANKGKKSDIALRVAPALRLQSDWSRHELTASGRANYQKSLDTGALTSLNINSQGRLRLDIRRSTQADVSLAYDLNETRDAERDLAASAAKPRRDQTATGTISLRQDFGAWFAEAGIGATGLYASDVTLNNGTTEDNGDRNYIQPDVRIRTGLSTGAIWQPFIEASYDPRFYNRAKDRNGIKRNSQNYKTALGVEFDDGGIWDGSIAAAYTTRDYSDATLKSEQALGIEGRATWRPGEFTSVDFNSTVGLQDNFTTGATAVRIWTVDLAISHALTDELKLSGGTGLVIEDGSTGTNATYSARLGAEWQLNPFFALTGEIGSTWYDAKRKSDGYDEQRASLSAVIRR
jgi:hypothetical protein